LHSFKLLFARPDPIFYEDLFRTDERTTVDSRARALRKSALLEVLEQFVVEVVDPDAARWIAVPADADL
jgi:hypothetical protein